MGSSVRDRWPTGALLLATTATFWHTTSQWFVGDDFQWLHDVRFDMKTPAEWLAAFTHANGMHTYRCSDTTSTGGFAGTYSIRIPSDTISWTSASFSWRCWP